MLEKVEEVYHEFNPGYVFEPQFVDHAYQEMYNTEQQVSMLIAWFAVLAILISCLGLFGLSIFTTQRRTKEIGIRKVLGLGIYGVVFLLSKDFSRMVLLAAAIAVPISYLLAERWLENFAYHIDLNWWLFIVVGFVALAVALLTVSYQALKTAITNPVNSLRSE